MKIDDPGFTKKLMDFRDQCPRVGLGNWTTCPYRSITNPTKAHCVLVSGVANGASKCTHPKHPINLPLEEAVLEDL